MEPQSHLISIALLAITTFAPVTAELHAADKPLKVFVCAGQSNMVGKRAKMEELPEDLKAEQKSLFFDDKKWVPLMPGKTEQEGFGPEISFAQAMEKKLKEPIGIIKHSVGGTNLAVRWSPDKPKSLYHALLNKVKKAQKARKIEIVGFVWVQGGSDAKSKKLADAYGKNLAYLIQRVRKDYKSPKMAVVCERIRNINTEKKPYMSVVRKAHEECKEDNYRWVDCDDVPRGSDNTHYTTKGYVLLGKKCADAMLALLKKKE